MLGYEGSERFVRWFAYLLFIDTMVAIPFAKLRLENKAKKFAIIKVVVIVITLGLNYFLLVTCGKIMAGEQFAFLRNLVAGFYEPDLAENGGYAFLSNLLANSLLLIFLAKELSQFRLPTKMG